MYFLQKNNSAVAVSKEISKSLESPFQEKISTTAFKVNNLVIYYPRDVPGEFPLVSNRIKLRAQMECKIIITIIIIMIVIIVIMTIIITISHIYKASLFVSAEVCNI